MLIWIFALTSSSIFCSQTPAEAKRFPHSSSPPKHVLTFSAKSFEWNPNIKYPSEGILQVQMRMRLGDLSPRSQKSVLPFEKSVVMLSRSLAVCSSWCYTLPAVQPVRTTGLVFSLSTFFFFKARGSGWRFSYTFLLLCIEVCCELYN